MLNALEIDVLSRTLYGEAEANDAADAIAIACVALNRTRHPKQWPANVAAVCQQPAQFSCWNASNPRLQEIKAVGLDDRWFAFCVSVAEDALAGRLVDPTDGATHYYASYIAMPKWAKGKTPCHATPAGKYTHLFFNDIDTPKPRAKAAAVVAATATAAGAAAEGVNQSGIIDQVEQAGQLAQAVQPIISALQALGPALPYALAAGAVALVAYAAWAVWRDRHDGGRT